LSRQLSDILGQISVFFFFAVMVITPLVILVLGIVNFTRDKLRQGSIILQAVAALAVWTMAIWRSEVSTTCVSGWDKETNHLLSFCPSAPAGATDFKLR
jgi:hypothetical protein